MIIMVHMLTNRWVEMPNATNNYCENSALAKFPTVEEPVVGNREMGENKTKNAYVLETDTVDR